MNSFFRLPTPSKLKLALAVATGASAAFLMKNTSKTMADGEFGFLKTAATVIPHPKKEYKGGEDAFLFRDLMFAVADGVGGWANKGVDVAKFSKQLVRKIGDVYSEQPTISPKEILHEAWKRTSETGSATVIIAVLNPKEKKIATTFLGDSGYMLLRPQNQELIKLYRSREQQHRFNCPFQCGTGKDHPYKALDEIHTVKCNDIIIMGTDGIWDNVYDHEIISLLKNGNHVEINGNLKDPQSASLEIARLAFEHSNDKKFVSPFQVHSEEDPKAKKYRGGKKDDITVIVSQIKLD